MQRSEDQEGLEVLISSDLELRSNINDSHAEALHTLQLEGNPEASLVQDHSKHGTGNITAAAGTREPIGIRKRRLFWSVTVIVLVVLIVVVAGVVGWVIGSKAAKSHDDSTPSSSTVKAKKTSPLAATGWRSDGKTNIQLFWQGEDDFVYSSSWDSEFHSWASAVKLNITAAPDTPMAAGVIYQQLSPPEPQIQFFYRNASNYLNGENFRASFHRGGHDSIDEDHYAFSMTQDSTLAAYWPLIVYGSSHLNVVWFPPNSTGYLPPEPLSSYGVVASPKASIAVLPLQRVHPTSNQTSNMDLKILYRRNDGYLYEFDRWSNGSHNYSSKT
jgi:hypothetical protein